MSGSLQFADGGEGDKIVRECEAISSPVKPEIERCLICRHPNHKAGDQCFDPLCRGHLYSLPPSSCILPTIFIQLTGHSLVGATRCEEAALNYSQKPHNLF